MEFERARLLEATVAAWLVLMTTDMVIFLDFKRGVRATFEPGGVGSGLRRLREFLAAGQLTERAEKTLSEMLKSFSRRARFPGV
jgi:hypothetical protein